MTKKVFSAVFLLLPLFFAHGQSAKEAWVDSVFSTLKTNEKAGQLFMVKVSSSVSEDDIGEIETLIKSHKVSGLIFSNGTPVRQAHLINRFQRLADVPLLISQDAEWGPGTSLDSTMTFPRSLILGAIQNDTLIYQYASVLAGQLKMLGVNVNFAPVVDVLSSYDDPAASYRSFGEEKTNVARKSVAYMRGLHDNGIIACAKYFPVKGLTVTGIANNLPVLKLSIDPVQAYPYSSLIESGLKAVLPAASQLPLFYEDPNLLKKATYRSGTLTSLFTGDWLKKNMNYKGLVLADISHIRQATEKERYGEAELLAFRAGNDLLLNPGEISPAIRKIRRFIRKEKPYASQLDNTVRKILELKFDAGLWQKNSVNTDNLVKRLHSADARLIRQKLYQQAITVLKNERNLIPIRQLDDRRFAYVAVDANENNRTFYTYLSKYVNFQYVTADDKSDLDKISATLKIADVIIVAVFPQSSINTFDKLLSNLQQLKPSREIIICDFGHDRILPSANKFPSVVTAYTNSEESMKGVPQVLFGAEAATGIIPFSAGQVKAGTGKATSPIDRLAYSIPEDVGMNSRVLHRIDSIVKEAMSIKATPGGQVIVARKGKVIYDKTFGHFMYDQRLPVNDTSIYDLASITKVAATLQTAMFMHDRGLVDLNKKVSFYLPELKKSNKRDITMVDMLTHQSGLVDFMLLYPLTMKDTAHLPMYYSRKKSAKYPLQVASNLFASPIIRDSVWSWIVKSNLVKKTPRTPYNYKYSDLGFMILHRLSEKVLNQPMEEFLAQNLYEPLGAHTLGFNPLSRFLAQTITPTEDDKIYRRTLVSGTVHDERAAMMGGIAGHAGLFSSATDLAKLGQMLLQGGTYGGYRYYKPETVSYFTRYKTIRRGIGWDKPVQSALVSPTSYYASPKTFGHTGFTGTCIWIDPEFDLLYIFLSNARYPDRGTKLLNANIRSRIQDVVYESIFRFEEQQVPKYIVSNLTQ